MNTKNLLLLILVISVGLFALFMACETVVEDDDDSVDQCNIHDDNMAEVPGKIISSNCEALGLNVLLDKIYANPTLSVFKIMGQYSITNDNTYFLSGMGILKDNACFDKIQNAGTYEIWTEFITCTSLFSIGVVTSMDIEAASFCSIDFELGIGCDDDDDNCPYATEFTWAYNECGLVLVDPNYDDMTLSEAIEDCNTCVGQCAAGYMHDEDPCPDFFTCLEGCF